MSQIDFGQFEYYKKLIELGAVLISFGTSTLIITYTRSYESKISFYGFSMVLSVIIGVLMIPFVLYFDLLILIIPLLFFSQFHHSNSITQAFNLVTFGSNRSSNYKMLVATIFSFLIILLYFIVDDKPKVLIYACYPLYAVGALFCIFYARKIFNEKSTEIRRFYKLFVAQIGNTFTLILSNFANIAFLLTDIFVIKYLAASEEISLKEIAIYSFALTIANLLIIIPTTVLNVDVEKFKHSHQTFESSRKKIQFLNYFIVPGVFLFYILLVFLIYEDYKDSWIIFSLIMTAKIFQIRTMPYGTYLGIKKKYTLSFYINLVTLIVNVVFSLFLYSKYNLIGIAGASIFSLLIRYIITKSFYKKIIHGWN